MARTKRPSTTSPSTSTSMPEQQSNSNPYSLLKSIVLVALLGSASFSTQLALHPLFGSTPTSLNHSRIVLSSCFISMLLPRLPERLTLLATASILACAPYATYALGVLSTQRWRDPVQDAALVQAAVLVPVLSSGVALVREWNKSLLRFLPGPISLKAGAALSTYNVFTVVETWLQRNVTLGGPVNSSSMLVASSAALTLLAASTLLSAIPSPPLQSETRNGKMQPHTRATAGGLKHTLPFFLPVLAAAFAFSRPPALSHTLPYTRQTAAIKTVNGSSAMQPATVRLLAREHGPTGLVVVGEHVEEEFRFMRVDHSLLGGRWLGDKVAPDARNGLGDSIYSTFVLQEAARLVKRKKQKNESALFIGLGVGVATEAFIAHGINTTVVEIDPVVYKYARQFFGLPEPAQVNLEDAREWVRQYRGDKFDYVVHDCFSGGGIPEHLYTLEFWTALQGIVKSDGVIAVNFAGKMGSDAARAIYLTLRKSFGTCRAFHDQIDVKIDPEYSFFNIVFFCSPKGSWSPRFREPEDEDYLVSHLRLHILSALPKREMNASMILGNVTYVSGVGGAVEGEERWILQDNSNSLGEWQREIGVEHWEVMREVLPDVFWETY